MNLDTLECPACHCECSPPFGGWVHGVVLGCIKCGSARVVVRQKTAAGDLRYLRLIRSGPSEEELIALMEQLDAAANLARGIKAAAFLARVGVPPTGVLACINSAPDACCTDPKSCGCQTVDDPVKE